MSDEKLIYTGGPAFPVNGPNGDHPGMMLRDYFAAKAMQGFVSGLMADGTACRKQDVPAIAESAYMMADAMLKARHQWPCWRS